MINAIVDIFSLPRRGFMPGWLTSEATFQHSVDWDVSLPIDSLYARALQTHQEHIPFHADDSSSQPDQHK